MDLKDRKSELKEILHIAEKQERLDAIKEEMKDPDFWLDHERAGKISQELKHLDDVIVKFELAETQDDIAELEEEAVYNGEHDDASCYISVHAGSGGTEAMDWAGMLLRMYLRFCEKNDFKTELLEETAGEEAGVKSSLIAVKGYRAFGRLKGEGGVHRLVRMSPFDADKARHTSFASVEVVPEIEKSSVEIKADELKIDVYRSGGHGGQGVNTTDSAVRITHLPTGIVVTCQNERSQLQNKQQAMKVLEAKLQLIEEDKRRAAEAKLKGQAVSASWGNQIRSYVLAPYQLIKDLRTGYETSDTQGVLDGEINLLLDSYGKWLAQQVK